MHKKLATDLISLAHSILQMKNKEDVFALKAKAHEVYEKLALLAYVEEYINNTPNATVTKEELVAKITAIEKETSVTNKSIIETKTSLIENTTLETINTADTSFDETILTENKDREEVPFTINEPVDKPFIEVASTKTEDTPTNNEIIEQPFDELENILFGDASNKDEASFIEEIKAPKTETEEIKSEIIEEALPTKNETILTLEETVSETTEITESETIITLKDTAPEIIEPIEKDPILTLDETTPKTAVDEITFSKESKTPTLEEELGDTLSVDVMANLFEKAPVKKTLNDRLLQDTIKIDLNDRIAFVKHLFEGNQEDFNRVISQLNTIKSEKSAKQFILKMVKPDYDWSLKEDYEARLLEIIERRFA